MVMDKKTLDYYAANALEVAGRYEEVPSALASKFDVAFTLGGKVLDIGCGSGRDLAVLARKGFDAYGVDPTSEFVDIAQRIHPELIGRVKVGQLPELGTPFDGQFDGLLCCAVLMHLETTQLEESLKAFKLVIKPDGRVLISVPSARADADMYGRDQYGRLFKDFSSNFLKETFEKHGFQLVGEWENLDTLKRSGVEWITQLYQLTI
jgi:2-polyprenyl-3-methyl-5-hydroxy-6-metoxy-1,4-benzoquinol methylase